MKKLSLVVLVFLLLVSGCSRSFDKNAAGYLSTPVAIQIFLEEKAPITVRDKESIHAIMAVLNDVEVDKLSVEEENEIVMQGKMQDATEMRFQDRQGSVYRAYLLAEGSLLVMEGATEQGGKQRNVFLSAPAQEKLFNEIHSSIMSQMTN